MRIFRDLLYYSMLISAYNLKIFSRRRFNIANYLSSSATTSPRVPPPGLVGHVKVMMIRAQISGRGLRMLRLMQLTV